VNLAALKPFVDNTDVFYPRAVIITFNFDSAGRKYHPSVKIHMPAGFYLKDNQRVLNVLSKIQDPTAHGIISRLLSEKIINGGNEKNQVHLISRREIPKPCHVLHDPKAFRNGPTFMFRRCLSGMRSK